MGYKHDRLPALKWLSTGASVLEKYAVPELELFQEEAKARMSEAMKGHTDPDEYARAACTVMLDSVIRSPRCLRVEAGVDPLPYFYMVACIKDGLGGSLAMPQVRGGIDERLAGRQGGRRRLLPAHTVLLLLYAARSGNPQEMLESKFGLDQTAISQCLAGTLSILTNPERMPTAVAVAGEIAGTPGDEAVEAIGRVINFDAIEIGIEAHGGKGSNDEAFPGKAQATTAVKAAFMCSQAGLLLAMGNIDPGCRHDAAALRASLPFLGDITRSMEDPDTPKSRRMTVNLDRGMLGAGKRWPGANVRIPARRAGGQAELPPDAPARNYSIGSERAIIENVLRRIKAYRLIGGTFSGSVDGMGDMTALVTGVVNLQRIMGGIDPARSHRRRPLRGPDKKSAAGGKPCQALG